MPSYWPLFIHLNSIIVSYLTIILLRLIYEGKSLYVAQQCTLYKNLMSNFSSYQKIPALFCCVEMVHGLKNALMLWRHIIAGIKECFEGHASSQIPPKSTFACLGCCSWSTWCIGTQYWASHGSLGVPYLLAAIMVGLVVIVCGSSPKNSVDRSSGMSMSHI